MDTPIPEQLVPTTGQRLEDVFHLSYRRLVVQLYGLTGDRLEAEDVVQEAFVRAVAAGPRFARTANPEAWLRTTAINLHRSRWRKLRNFSRIKDRLGTTEDVPGLEDRLDVIEALRALPSDQREVLALHHLADLTVADIGRELGLPEGTVKSRLSRGREALARALGTDEEVRHV
jgi:RNA polymerase sigma-70 factor (ECF subfamily)